MSTRTLETAQTAEDAQKIFAARAQYYRDMYSNRAYVDSALKFLQLDRHLGNGETVYRVKTARLAEALGETVEVRVPEGYGSLRVMAETQIQTLVNQWARALTDEDIEVVGSSERIDVTEWHRRFGATGQLPPVGSDEVTAAWQELVNASLTWADQNDVCDSFEIALRRMGFGEFLPPQEMDVEAVVDGVTLRVERVEANRQGHRGKGVSPENFAAALYQKLRRRHDLEFKSVPSADTDDDA